MFGPTRRLSRVRREPADLIDLALRGGYPEVLGAGTRQASPWFRSYVTTMLQRDVRDPLPDRGPDGACGLLSVLAARSSSLLNIAELSRTPRLPHTTLTRYLALLENAFLCGASGLGLAVAPAYHQEAALLIPIPACSVISPVSRHRASAMTRQPWSLLESLVASELLKQLA